MMLYPSDMRLIILLQVSLQRSDGLTANVVQLGRTLSSVLEEEADASIHHLHRPHRSVTYSLPLPLFPLSGVRCCPQLFHCLICYSSPPSSVSCLLLPVSLLSCIPHISLSTVLPSQPWSPYCLQKNGWVTIWGKKVKVTISGQCEGRRACCIWRKRDTDKRPPLERKKNTSLKNLFGLRLGYYWVKTARFWMNLIFMILSTWSHLAFLLDTVTVSSVDYIDHFHTYHLP